MAVPRVPAHAVLAVVVFQLDAVDSFFEARPADVAIHDVELVGVDYSARHDRDAFGYVSIVVRRPGQELVQSFRIERPVVVDAWGLLPVQLVAASFVARQPRLVLAERAVPDCRQVAIPGEAVFFGIAAARQI